MGADAWLVMAIGAVGGVLTTGLGIWVGYLIGRSRD